LTRPWYSTGDGSLFREKEKGKEGPGTIGKNFFPYLTNSRQVDPDLGYPPIDFYGPVGDLPLRHWDLDDKDPKDRADCLAWLESLKKAGYKYSVKEQLRAYCKLDTLIEKGRRGVPKAND